MDSDQVRQKIRQCIQAIIKEELPELPQIIVELRDGKLTVRRKPRGIELLAYSYDIDEGVDPDLIAMGPTKEPCLVACWSGVDKVIPEEFNTKDIE